MPSGSSGAHARATSSLAPDCSASFQPGASAVSPKKLQQALRRLHGPSALPRRPRSRRTRRTRVAADQCTQLFHVGGLGRTLPADHPTRGSGDKGLIEHRRRAGRLVPRERDAQGGGPCRGLDVPGGGCATPSPSCSAASCKQQRVTSGSCCARRSASASSSSTWRWWRSWRSPLALLATIGLGSDPRVPPMATWLAVTETTLSRPIPPGFLGLSLEYNSIEQYAGTDPGAIDPVFVQLVRNPEPGPGARAADRRRYDRLDVVAGPRPATAAGGDVHTQPALDLRHPGAVAGAARAPDPGHRPRGRQRRAGPARGHQAPGRPRPRVGAGA